MERFTYTKPEDKEKQRQAKLHGEDGNHGEPEMHHNLSPHPKTHDVIRRSSVEEKEEKVQPKTANTDKPSQPEKIMSRKDQRKLKKQEANLSKQEVQADEKPVIRELNDEEKKALERKSENEKVGKLLDIDPELIEKFRQEDSRFRFNDNILQVKATCPNENLEQMPPKEIDQLTYQALTIEKDLEQGSNGSGKSGAWATSKIRSSANSIVAAYKNSEYFPGGEYTIHHKISRNNLHKLYDQMNEEDKKGGSTTASLRAVLDTIGPTVGSPNHLKILCNMPANLEIGPPVHKRIGDPGSGFDGSIQDNAYTPRSETLSQVDSLITTKSIDFAKVASLLERAHSQHIKGTPRGQILSNPKLDQWEKGKNNKFRRDGDG